jgi:hypothetical protein
MAVGENAVAQTSGVVALAVLLFKWDRLLLLWTGLGVALTLWVGFFFKETIDRHTKFRERPQGHWYEGVTRAQFMMRMGLGA